MKDYFTLEEIRQQPDLWENTLDRCIDVCDKNGIIFLSIIHEKYPNCRVIFTGAGTSNYVGDAVLPHLKVNSKYNFSYESIPTTDIVSNPKEYLQNVPTILVSFARSGNSPESVAAVELAKQEIDVLYQVVITCNKDGALAKNSYEDKNTLLLLLDEKTNDRGFAMTSSFTCMTLSALLLFGNEKREVKKDFVNKISKLGRVLLSDESKISDLVFKGFLRVVYLGSGSLGKYTREAQLKILELTAGKITACFDSSMGFRHGPKSFVDDKTLIVSFISNNRYTKQYDLDIISEIYNDSIAKYVYPIYVEDEFVNNYKDVEDVLNQGYKLGFGLDLPDAYLGLVYIILAQLIGVYAAISIDNDVDNPSASGTVNRVVKGVTIHPYK